MGFFDFLKTLGNKDESLSEEEQTAYRFQLLREGAESGNAEDQYWLGMSYMYGFSTEENHEKAGMWLRKSVEQGFVPAKHLLGSLYLGSDIENTRIAGIDLLAQAAEEGNDEAQYLLGICFVNGEVVEKDFKKALFLFTKAGEQGNDEAIFEIGKMYELGNGVERDMGEALNWYADSAKKGNPRAMFEIGYAFMTGDGLEEDPKEAFDWLYRAADRDHVDSMGLIGQFFQEGYGTELDYDKANKVLTLAARKGSGYAMYRLGLAYEEGWGVKQSPKDAFDLYVAATQNGFPEAQEDVDRLRNNS